MDALLVAREKARRLGGAVVFRMIPMSLERFKIQLVIDVVVQDLASAQRVSYRNTTVLFAWQSKKIKQNILLR